LLLSYLPSRKIQAERLSAALASGHELGLKQLENLNPAETDAPHVPRILIVDDDLFQCTALRTMLELNGFEIEEASDGQDAVRKFRAHPADLVLCDMFMPKADGLEVLRELSSGFVGANIIAMSGGGYGGTVDVLANGSTGRAHLEKMPPLALDACARAKVIAFLVARWDRWTGISFDTSHFTPPDA
jgi:CheY-like chemotaxis protein